MNASLAETCGLYSSVLSFSPMFYSAAVLRQGEPASASGVGADVAARREYRLRMGRIH